MNIKMFSLIFLLFQKERNVNCSSTYFVWLFVSQHWKNLFGNWNFLMYLISAVVGNYFCVQHGHRQSQLAWSFRPSCFIFWLLICIVAMSACETLSHLLVKMKGGPHINTWETAYLQWITTDSLFTLKSTKKGLNMKTQGKKILIKKNLK